MMAASQLPSPICGVGALRFLAILFPSLGLGAACPLTQSGSPEPTGGVVNGPLQYLPNPVPWTLDRGAILGSLPSIFSLQLQSAHRPSAQVTGAAGGCWGVQGWG